MENVSRTELEGIIKLCLHDDPQAQAVVIGLLLEGLSLKEAGDTIGVGPQRVVEIKTAALAHLRACQALLDYLEARLDDPEATAASET